MIELSDKIVAIWFLQLDEEADFMGCLEREEEDYFTLSFRFRYYVVEGPDFSGWDEKNWYKGDYHGTKEKAIEAVEVAIKNLEKTTGNKADRIMASTGEAYMEILKTMPWAHMKEMTPEEFEAIKRGEPDEFKETFIPDPNSNPPGGSDDDDRDV